MGFKYMEQIAPELLIESSSKEDLRWSILQYLHTFKQTHQVNAPDISESLPYSEFPFYVSQTLERLSTATKGHATREFIQLHKFCIKILKQIELVKD